MISQSFQLIFIDKFLIEINMKEHFSNKQKYKILFIAMELKILNFIHNYKQFI